ncbi:hypothetical protein [Streptococcus halichoeri]|nr:hypothetical protein [Streptococcus halichoeri]
MKKEYISYLSGLIFIIYALLISNKLLFLSFGLVLFIIGYADRIKHK